MCFRLQAVVAPEPPVQEAPPSVMPSTSASTPADSAPAVQMAPAVAAPAETASLASAAAPAASAPPSTQAAAAAAVLNPSFALHPAFEPLAMFRAPELSRNLALLGAR